MVAAPAGPGTEPGIEPGLEVDAPPPAPRDPPGAGRPKKVAGKAGKPDRPDRPDTGKPDKPAPGIDADAVLAKFKAVSREYKQFKQKFGSRLDAEWTDLATLAQFAGKSPDRLAQLDRKLDRFRSQMNAQQ